MTRQDGFTFSVPIPGGTSNKILHSMEHTWQYATVPIMPQLSLWGRFRLWLWKRLYGKKLEQQIRECHDRIANRTINKMLLGELFSQGSN